MPSKPGAWSARDKEPATKKPSTWSGLAKKRGPVPGQLARSTKLTHRGHAVNDEETARLQVQRLQRAAAVQLCRVDRIEDMTGKMPVTIAAEVRTAIAAYREAATILNRLHARVRLTRKGELIL